MYHRWKCEKGIEYEEIIKEFNVTNENILLREHTECQGVDMEKL
jgi:hypothetical protein